MKITKAIITAFVLAMRTIRSRATVGAKNESRLLDQRL